MKICIVSTFMGQKWAGGEISTYLYTKHLAEKVEVFALTAKLTEKLPFKTYHFPILNKIPNIFLIVGNSLIEKYLEKKITKILKKEKPDIVHIEDFFMMIPAQRAAKKLNIPTIMTIRSTTFAVNLTTCLNGNKIPYKYTRKQYKKWLYDTIEETYKMGCISNLILPWFYSQNNKMKYYFKKNDCYIGVSEFIRKEAVKTGINNKNTYTIKVIGTEWKFEKSKSIDKEIKIFTAGTLTKFKGFDYVIKAFKDVVKKYPKAKLRIAGTGSEEKKLSKLIAKLNLKNNVFLLGRVNHDQMKQEYLKATFVLAPSIGPECLSRIIFEAFSLKKTVISTNVGGNPELVINNKTGLVVKNKDSKEMTKAMIKLINNINLTKKLGNNAYALLNKESDTKKIVQDHIKIYNKIIR